MNLLSLTGLTLLYVGVVLFVNGLWLLDKLDKKEIVFIDSFVGLTSFLIALYLVFSPGATFVTIKAGAFTLLFSCTYWWVAFNQHQNADGRGLGWYCLFVAITAVPVTISTYKGAHTIGEVWFAICWGMWAVLWFAYFLNLVFSKATKKAVGWLTLFIGLVSAWVPGYLFVCGYIQ